MQPSSIEGLKIICDFISLEEEKEILNNVEKSNKTKSTIRSVQRFGFSKPYRNAIVSESIPSFLDKISQKIFDSKLLSSKPCSVTINEYHINQQIGPHIDNKESGEVITILSLLGEGTMVFQKDRAKFIFEFPPRCLIQMFGEARNEWQHSILPVKTLRYSIVFRCANL